VNECTSALDALPAYHKALVRRAKAYEQMGHFKQALSDIQKANKADTANPETQARTPSGAPPPFAMAALEAAPDVLSEDHEVGLSRGSTTGLRAAGNAALQPPDVLSRGHGWRSAEGVHLLGGRKQPLRSHGWQREVRLGCEKN
jgi:hypothetical protein